MVPSVMVNSPNALIKGTPGLLTRIEHSIRLGQAVGILGPLMRIVTGPAGGTVGEFVLVVVVAATVDVVVIVVVDDDVTVVVGAVVVGP